MGWGTGKDEGEERQRGRPQRNVSNPHHPQSGRRFARLGRCKRLPWRGEGWKRCLGSSPPMVSGIWTARRIRIPGWRRWPSLLGCDPGSSAQGGHRRDGQWGKKNAIWGEAIAMPWGATMGGAWDRPGAGATGGNAPRQNAGHRRVEASCPHLLLGCRASDAWHAVVGWGRGREEGGRGSANARPWERPTQVRGLDHCTMQRGRATHP